MGETAEVLAAMGCPIDGDEAFWDEFFGPDVELPGQRRGYSTAKQAGSGPFRSWEDYIARTSESERVYWCAVKAKKANTPRLVSGAPDVQVTKGEVWRLLEEAQGRCCYCGSLAVERAPFGPWEHMGRRIGTLEHLQARCDGGSNAPSNLAWACHWCNTHPSERRRGALDHGGFYPPSIRERGARRVRVNGRTRSR